jgi:hypothetical protein
MRADMAKVIVERPRFGSSARGRSKGTRRREERLGFDSLPRREGINRACRGGTKSLNEHLGPLRRYLARQVGRPWDEVFAEICAHISRDSAVQDHVRDHVFDYVTVHVIVRDGIPCHAAGNDYGEPLGRWRSDRFYVCPVTRRLRSVPPDPEHTKRARALRRKHPDCPAAMAWLDADHYCCRVNGQWRLVEVEPFTDSPTWGFERDVILGRAIDRREAQRVYGKPVYAASWRFIGKRELKKLPVAIDW